MPEGVVREERLLPRGLPALGRNFRGAIRKQARVRFLLGR